MPRLATADIETVHQLAAELCTVKLDAPTPLEPTLAKVRAFVGLDAMLVFEPVERLSGFGVARIDLDNLPNPTRFATRLTEVLARAPHRFWCFDAIAPEAGQRDRVIDTGADADSFISRELLVPERLATHRVLRALVCSGPTLLGWVGGFHAEPLEPGHRDRLTALLPAFRRRLAHDRLVRTRELAGGVAVAVLDHLDEAAFVVGRRGELAHVNRLGRERLAADREGTLALLHSADVDRVPLELGYHLVVTRAGTALSWETRIARASTRWRLTPRQREVLHWIVQGRSNASIALELGISERGVEQHVSAILDRATVNSRASLVAVVLGSLVLPGALLAS